eukprot:PhM_4_TR16738/c0_g1_i2/m.30402
MTHWDVNDFVSACNSARRTAPPHRSTMSNEIRAALLKPFVHTISTMQALRLGGPLPPSTDVCATSSMMTGPQAIKHTLRSLHDVNNNNDVDDNDQMVVRWAWDDAAPQQKACEFHRRFRELIRICPTGLCPVPVVKVVDTSPSPGRGRGSGVTSVALRLPGVRRLHCHTRRYDEIVSGNSNISRSLDDVGIDLLEWEGMVFAWPRETLLYDVCWETVRDMPHPPEWAVERRVRNTVSEGKTPNTSDLRTLVRKTYRRCRAQMAVGVVRERTDAEYQSVVVEEGKRCYGVDLRQALLLDHDGRVLKRIATSARHDDHVPHVMVDTALDPNKGRTRQSPLHVQLWEMYVAMATDTVHRVDPALRVSFILRILDVVWPRLTDRMREEA